MRYEREILKNLKTDDYYKKVIGDLEKIFIELILFIEENEEDLITNRVDIQIKLDETIIKINNLDEEKDINIDTIGREELAEEFYFILKFYKFERDIEEAIRMREW